MRGFLKGAVVASLVLLPALAQAQEGTASIAGVVRDTSGAVLPGVTVEAASPELIEKVRTAVTDGTGQYKIISLRPGVYTVTFDRHVDNCAIEVTSRFENGSNTLSQFRVNPGSSTSQVLVVEADAGGNVTVDGDFDIFGMCPTS